MSSRIFSKSENWYNCLLNLPSRHAEYSNRSKGCRVILFSVFSRFWQNISRLIKYKNYRRKIMVNIFGLLH